jgi:hypothetical protein
MVRYQCLSLVGVSGVLEPTRLMATTWISMRPMYYAAFGVPLEHTVERDSRHQSSAK